MDSYIGLMNSLISLMDMRNIEFSYDTTMLELQIAVFNNTPATHNAEIDELKTKIQTKQSKFSKVQRQKVGLLKRLHVPRPIQFRYSFDKTIVTKLFKLLENFRPESPLPKEQRPKTEDEAKGKEVERKMEPKKVSIVTKQVLVLAKDVVPCELLLLLTSLCRKVGLAYRIV